MADKQFARSGTPDFDFLAEDDPLSELARIVGYEEKPRAVRSEPEPEFEPVSEPETVRKPEPVFGLEDELMRAFEDYEAPRFDPVKTVADRFAERDLKSREPVFEPELFDEAPAAAPEVFAEPALAAEPDHFEPEAVEPEVGFEPEAVAYSSDLPAELAVEDQKAFEPEPMAFEPSDEAAFAEEPVYPDEPEPAEDLAASWQSAAAEDVSVFAAGPEAGEPDTISELERELELSIGYAEPETVSPNEAEEGAQASFAPAAEPAAQAEDFNEAFAVDEPVAEAVSRVEPETRPAAGSFDALLDEVDMYPVPVSDSTPLVQEPAADHPAVSAPVRQPAARKNNYPFTPSFGRATPVAVAGGAAVSSAFAMPYTQARSAPIAEEVKTEPANAAPQEADDSAVGDLNAAFEEPRSWASIAHAEEPAAPAADEPDMSIEFDLDTIDLDLSDLDLDADPSEFAMSAEEAFADKKAAPQQQVAEPVAAVHKEDRPVREAPVRAEPVLEEPSRQEQPQDEQPLPFDPSQIADAGEPVSAMAEMHVPSLPVVEKETPRALQQDYDFDIDAEMEQFFAASKPAVDPEPKPSAEAGLASDPVWAAARDQVERKKQADTDGLDEFERALEADFRRSLNEPRMAAPSMDDENIDPAYFHEEEPRRRVPFAVMAAAAAVLVIGGAGVYAFVGGDSGQASSDGPQIILADKDPVKIVPEERGGKTVPNQDKAVYDRVSGNQVADPAQESLVSTTEEPVDVVQRTLVPENSLPLEGEADDTTFRLPGVDDAADARLLPEGEAVETAAAGEQPVSGVSPRKVRTMIVKPDGTLVAREETVAGEEPAPVEREVASAEARIEPVSTPVAEADPVETPIRDTEVALAQPEAEETTTGNALADAANATVEGTAPVRTVKTTTITGQMPVPGTRPAEQPVNVVGTVTDQGNVRGNAENAPAAETANASETAQAETTPVSAVNPGGYVVQIASLPSEADANASYRNLSSKFASVIGGRGVDIRKADIPGKGTFYRVRIPAGSKAEAVELCTRYKSAGGSCLVSK